MMSADSRGESAMQYRVVGKVMRIDFDGKRRRLRAIIDGAAVACGEPEAQLRLQCADQLTRTGRLRFQQCWRIVRTKKIRRPDAPTLPDGGAPRQ
jgi:hypothetical protein